MNWKNMTIGRKITLGFAVVLLLLAVAGGLSYYGVGQIVGNAEQVIAGNKLDGNLAQKEVDHLNWANQVNALLTDDSVTELKVQTDPHQCAFGKWLYGQGRQHAEGLVPSLAPLFKDIETPHAKLHASAVAIGKHFKPADAALPGFLAEKEADHLGWAGDICRCFLKNDPALTVQTDPHKCSFGKWYYSEAAKKAVAGNPELERLYAAIGEPHAKLHASAAEIAATYRQIHPGLLETLMERLDDHRRWAARVAQGIITGRSELGVETDPHKCGLGKWLASEQAQGYINSFPALAQAVEALTKPHAQLHASATDIQNALTAGESGRAQALYQERTLPALEEVAGQLGQVIAAEKKLVESQEAAKLIYDEVSMPLLATTGGLLKDMKAQAEQALAGQSKAAQIFATETTPALHATQELLGKIRAQARGNIMTDQAMLDAAQGTRLQVTIVGAVAIVVGLLLSFFIVRGITSVLRRISAQMGEGADQVAAASEQVSAASQSLAEGASQQAASIEETSSSLEEMASMTRQNADNAQQADGLMKESSDIVTKANQSMGQLRGAMEKINSASEETAGIIKTIDEIAFQTNLLALNAAVEAARAGEAGAGFAVVADEVRNLAIRAAEAAKNTASLIEGNIANIKEGSQLVHSTDEAFKQVAESAGKVGELVGEIAAASGEQSQGIDQINTAATEMDKVTQQVSSNAEESAASSEELNAQAATLNGMVQELKAMVDGRGKSNKRIAARPQPKALPGPKPSTERQAVTEKAKQEIPLDQGQDFADF